MLFKHTFLMWRHFYQNKLFIVHSLSDLNCFRYFYQNRLLNPLSDPHWDRYHCFLSSPPPSSIMKPTNNSALRIENTNNQRPPPQINKQYGIAYIMSGLAWLSTWGNPVSLACDLSGTFDEFGRMHRSLRVFTGSYIYIYLICLM